VADTLILAGDAGGTKTNLALYRRHGERISRERIATYRSRDFPGLEKILRRFLRERATIARACIGVAGPVVAGRCRLTNLDWMVEEEALRRFLGIREAYLVNDLQAMSSAVPFLPAESVVTLQAGVRDPRGNVAVLAAGTGLGEGFLIGTGKGYLPLASEGGHVDFAARTGEEMRLHAFLMGSYGRVSVERVLSGPGLRDIHRFLRQSEGIMDHQDVAAETEGESPQHAIVRHGLAGRSPACSRALRIFASLYGAEAGNLALQYLATGGVYLGGGIAPAILPALREEGFLSAFRDKGRMAELLSRIPVSVILDPLAPLLGAAHYAAWDGLLPPGDFHRSPAGTDDIM
jgi:glucokinase